MNPLERGSALIKFWLHEAPSQDLETWQEQLLQSAFMEKRIFEALAQILCGKPKK